MAVRSLFKSRGFEFQNFDPGALSVRETVAMLRQAKYLIGAHGAGLTNLAFMHPHTAVLEIFPHNFVDSMYRSLAGFRNIRYLFYQATEAESISCHPALAPSEVPNGYRCAEFYKNSDLLLDIDRLNSTVIALERLLHGQDFNYEVPTLKSGPQCVNSTVKWCDSPDVDARAACHLYPEMLESIIPTSPLCQAEEVLKCPDPGFIWAPIDAAVAQKPPWSTPAGETCDRKGNVTCLNQDGGCLVGKKRANPHLSDDEFYFEVPHRLFP